VTDFESTLRTDLRKVLTLFPPDPLQCLAELTFAHWTGAPLPSEHTADPPHLKTAKGKGNQTQLDGSPVQMFHDAACCFCTFRHRLDCWCWLSAHWVLQMTAPQGSPSSSHRDRSMPLAGWKRLKAGAVVTNPVSRQRNRGC
jgi:hypothetical protein